MSAISKGCCDECTVDRLERDGMLIGWYDGGCAEIQEGMRE